MRHSSYSDDATLGRVPELPIRRGTLFSDIRYPNKTDCIMIVCVLGIIDHEKM